MSQTRILELSDAVYTQIQRQAEAAGTSPAHWLAHALEQQYGHGHVWQSALARRTAAEQQVARARFEEHFGEVWTSVTQQVRTTHRSTRILPENMLIRMRRSDAPGYLRTPVPSQPRTDLELAKRLARQKGMPKYQSYIKTLLHEALVKEARQGEDRIGHQITAVGCLSGHDCPGAKTPPGLVAGYEAGNTCRDHAGNAL